MYVYTYIAMGLKLVRALGSVREQPWILVRTAFCLPPFLVVWLGYDMLILIFTCRTGAAMGPAGPEFTDSSSEETVTEEAPAMTAKSKAVPRSPETETSESETAPNPSGKGGHGMEAPAAEGVGKGNKGMGKGRAVCEFCWQPITNHQSGREQHQSYNLHCLQWQRYLRGGVTWTQARNWAMQVKMDREDEAIPPGAPSSGSRPPPPPPPEPKRLPALRARTDKVDLREKKNRKEKKDKTETKHKDKKYKKEKKLKKKVSPSPSPPKRHRRRGDSPGSSGEDKKPRRAHVRRTGPGTFEISIA